jgi:hypothetical protein
MSAHNSGDVNGIEIALKTDTLYPKMQKLCDKGTQVADNAWHVRKIPARSENTKAACEQMERQRQIESDSVRDGCVRWAQNTEYHQATDTKPYRNLIGCRIRPKPETSIFSRSSRLPTFLPDRQVGLAT